MIFVTGGAGFIGSAVIREILSHTNHSVVNIDKLTYAANLSSLPNVDDKRYFFEKIDISDNAGIRKLFQKYNPDYVMHLAAESHVDRSIENPIDFIQTNIVGTFNLLNCSLDYFKNSNNNQVKKNFKFHHISTDEVYGDLVDKDVFFTEKTPYDPSSPYSASKASSDHLVRAWHRTYGLPISITNCSNNYGPYHFPEKLIPHMILNCLHENHLPIYGDGMQIRDWLYVEDHAKALLKVLFEGKNGETYNIGGNNEKTNIYVVKKICRLLDEMRPRKKGSYIDLIKYVDDRPGHDQRYAIDASRIKNDLNWIPEETFESGIKKTIKWYLDNKDWWQDILNRTYNLGKISK